MKCFILFGTIFFNFYLSYGQVEAGKEPEILFQLGHGKEIKAIKFSQDGKLMATMDEQNILIWDAERFLVIKRISTLGEAGGVEFTPDNEYLITSRNVFNIESGKPEKNNYSITNRNLKIGIIQESPVYIFLKQDELLIQNGYSGKEISRTKLREFPPLDLVNKSKVSSDGNYLIIALKEKGLNSEKTAIKIWDLKTGLQKYDFQGHEKRILQIEYCPENKLLYSLGAEKVLKCWNLKTGKLNFEISLINGYTDYKGVFYSLNTLALIKSFIISRDEKKIFVSSSVKDSIYYFDALTGKRIGYLLDKYNAAFGKIIAINPTGKILVVASDDSLAFYNTDDKSEVNAVYNPVNKIYNFKSYTPGKFISNDDKGSRVWDFSNPLKFCTTVLATKNIGIFSVSPQNKKVAIGRGFDKPDIFNTDDFSRINSAVRNEPCIPIFLNEDSVFYYAKKYNFNETEGEYVELINTKGQTLKHFSLPPKCNLFKYILFDHFKKLLFLYDMSLEKSGFLACLDLEDGKIEYNFLPEKKNIYDIRIVGGGKTLIIVSDVIEFWDLKTKRKEKVIADINGFNFNSLGKLLIDEFNDNLVYEDYLMHQIVVWSLKNGALKNKYDLNERGFQLVELVNNNKFKYIGIDDNGRIKFYDNSFNDIATLFCYGTDDYFITTPDLFYLSSKSFITQNILFKQDKKIYSFEQVDIKYNRPDIVLKRLGLASEGTINLCEKAYVKRTSRLGYNINNVNSSKLGQPKIKIVNENDIRPFSESLQIYLKVEAEDSKFLLSTFQLIVNGVPLYGEAGLRIKNKSTFKTDVSVTLNNGKNKIQVFVVNSEGIESERKIFNINFKNDYKPDLYFIGIGVSQYKYYETLPNVDNDIRDFIKLLSNNREPHYNKLIIDSLINENAVNINFRGLKEKLFKTNVDDEIILYFSGHGKLDENKDLYLGTFDLDFPNPSAKGILYENLVKLLDSIPARKKLILINACQAGEYDEQKDVLSIMKALFADFGKNTGTTIISSSGWDESSYSSNLQKNSNFGKAILMSLKTQKGKYFKYLAADLNEDGIINVLEFKKYIEEKVPLLSLNKQVPFIRNENTEMNFRIH